MVTKWVWLSFYSRLDFRQCMALWACAQTLEYWAGQAQRSHALVRASCQLRCASLYSQRYRCYPHRVVFLSLFELLKDLGFNCDSDKLTIAVKVKLFPAVLYSFYIGWHFINFDRQFQLPWCWHGSPHSLLPPQPSPALALGWLLWLRLDTLHSQAK